MVSNYIQDCKYSLLRLQPYVYLISEDALKDIRIDNGNAYVDTISQTPIRLDAYNVTLNESESLDERYRFTHTLTFSVNGYTNKDDFQDRYYAIVKDEEGTYWLVNAMFPCKVTYTYNLGYEQNHTDFTIGTVSNHPVLRLEGMVDSTPYECKKYYLSGIEKLWLNEKKYTVHDGNDIKYTNDGFKEIEYNKRSALFTEEFNGTNVSHTINFNVLFSDYKSSWHYNLLEFKDNLYAAVMKTTEGKYALCGFGYGLQPSFTVNADDNENIDHVEVTLQDSHDIGDVLYFYDDVTYEYLSGKTWEFTSEYDGYECVSAGIARYLLQKEVDALGNETGNYKALSGYTDQFPGINIVGEFTGTTEFLNSECGDNECTISTSFPSTIKFTTKGTQTYTINADSNWSITSSNENIAVSPSSGNGGRYYTVSVTNSLTPTSSAVTATLTLSYCNTTRNVTVTVVQDEDACFYLGRTYDISANAQTVSIPSNCCIQSVKESTSYGVLLTYTQYSISAYVPENNSGIRRTIILLVVFCDGTSQNVIINQSYVFEKWTNEGTTCIGRDLYNVERLYTGTTSGSMTARTETVRNTLKQANSRECIIPEHMTADTGNYTCEECTQFKYFNTITSGDSYYTVTGVCDTSTLVVADISARTDIQSSQVGSCVTAIGDGAFSGCTGVGFINLPDGVTSIGNRSFAGCDVAGNITIPLTVTSIGDNAFSGCTSLGDVTLPNGLTSLGTGAFRECKNFPLVNIPKSLTSIPSYCFYDCDGLYSIEFHENITSIGDYALANCNGLCLITSKSVIPPAAGSNTFTGLSSISKVYVPAQSVDTYKAATGWSTLSNNIYAIQ